MREVVGLQDREAVVRDVAVDFWVGEEECTLFGLHAVEVFEDTLGVGNGGDSVNIYFDEPSSAKVGTPVRYA